MKSIMQSIIVGMSLSVFFSGCEVGITSLEQAGNEVNIVTTDAINEDGNVVIRTEIPESAGDIDVRVEIYGEDSKYFTVALEEKDGIYDGIITEKPDNPPFYKNTTFHFFTRFVLNGQNQCIGSVTKTILRTEVAPVARDQTVTLDENTDITIDLNATDKNNDTIKYFAQTFPKHGTLSGNSTHIVYTPDTDYFGTDSFTYLAKDDMLNESNIATVSIVINDVIDISTDTQKPTITLNGTDVNLTVGDVYIDAGATANDNVDGDMTVNISINNPVDTNIAGTYTINYDVNDSAGNMADTVRRTVTVSAVIPNNNAPIAYNINVEMNGTTTIDFNLTANDVDGDDLNYTIIIPPDNGFFSNFDRVSGEITYDSDGYIGSTSFTYKVNDGHDDSNAATVNIEINPLSDIIQPIITLNGSDINLTTDEIYVELGATAIDNADGNLTTSIVISGSIDPKVVGTYIINYDVNDSAGNVADTVTRNVNVLDGNDIPVAQGASYVMDEDANLTITLEGNDSDVGAVLTYFIVDNPTNGNVLIVGNEVRYIPDADYFGIDGFTFVIRDEFNATSNVASVDISITEVAEPNTSPIAQDMNISMESNISLITFELNASDVDITDTLTYTIVDPPAYGAVSQGSPGSKNIAYMRGTYTGNDNFTYKVNDGNIDSNIATVYIESNVPNSPPVAYNQSINLDASGAAIIILDANDTDRDALTYRIVRSPSYGTIRLVNNQVTYIPNTDYTGNDSFKFIANDGTDDSNKALVYVEVAAIQPTSQLFAWCALNDVELWQTDGTTGGTQIVKDIQISGSANPESFVKIKNTYFFVADDGVHGRELWKSQGTEGSTVLVKDIDSTRVSSSNPHNLIDINGTLFFVAKDERRGVELWKSDGTRIGTKRVKNINPLGHSKPENLTNVDGILYFTADDGQNGRELWKSNGTRAGTKQVNDIYNGGSSNPKYLTNVNGVLYFSADDGGTLNLGRELWFYNTNISDEASNYTNRGFYDIYRGEKSSNPQNLFNYKGTLVFSADDGVNGYELWKNDGSKAELVENYAGVNTVFGDYRYFDSFPHAFSVVGDALYFSASQFLNGENLRKIDTIDSPIELIRYEDYNNTFRIPNPENLISVNDTLFFSTYQELKDSNGTVIDEQIFQGTPEGYYAVHGNSRELVNYGIIDNALLFRTISPDGSAVLKISDGTTVNDLLNGCEL